MAREEHDREDLLREATAFVDRAEFDVPGFATPVFVGIRQDGAVSVYFGPDQVYHVNARGELRRAYLNGLLYKADRGQLVSLERRREAVATSLVARRLSAEETAVFLREMHSALATLADSVQGEKITIRGQVTSSETAGRNQTAYSRIAKWLAEIPQQLAVARSPRAT